MFDAAVSIKKSTEGSLIENKKPIRCLICGPDGTGKSTLTDFLGSESQSQGLPYPELREADGSSDGAGKYHFKCVSLKRRSYVFADIPGGNTYASSLVAEVPNAELTLFLIDASVGVTEEVRRYAAMISLLGMRHLILGVNKIDLVNYDFSVYNRIVKSFNQAVRSLAFSSVKEIPLSARFGDNLTKASTNTPWYSRDPLINLLEAHEAESDSLEPAMRFLVKSEESLDSALYGLSGAIASGCVSVGDEIIAAGSGLSTKVRRVTTLEGCDLPSSVSPEAVTLFLENDISASGGDVLCHIHERPSVVDQFACRLIWLSEAELIPNRSYAMFLNSRALSAVVTNIKYKYESMGGEEKLAAKTLSLNEIGFCNIATSEPVVIDPYEKNRTTGRFKLIDKATNATAAVGLVEFPLRRATNIHLQSQAVSKAVRSGLKNQRSVIIWFTGLSGSGKSTIANVLETKLIEARAHTIMLDGDNLRHGLNKDLGFTDADRVENIRRVGEVARIMVDAGLIVLCAFISPFRAERRMVRSLVGRGEFIEVFVDTPLETCMQRDPKGLYKKALNGEIKNFTGVDHAYERPEDPAVHINDPRTNADEIARQIVDYMRSQGVFSP